MSYQQLFTLLDDDAAVGAALEQDKLQLSPRARSNLKQLYSHFLRPAPSTLTTRFRNMDALQVPHEWVDHIRRHGTNPAPIWRSKPRGDAPSLALHAHAVAVARKTASPDSDQAIKNLCYLSVYDLLRRMFPKFRHTQRGLGPLIIARLELLAPPMEETLEAIVGVGAVDSIVHWYNLGLAANVLAARFGPGCLFVLGESISDDFLLKLPKAGSEYEKLVKELEVRLQLPEVLVATRLGELGEALRTHFLSSLDYYDLVQKNL